MALEPGTTVGAYSILGVIGSGNAATVYEAEREGEPLHFALKLLSWQNDALREGMKREAAALRTLHHVNVVRIHEVVEFARQPGLVLELVDGGFTLGAAMARQPVTLEQAEVIVRALLEGVGAAHARGIVHRDLKPENVLLARASNNVAIPKVSDFGLAKAHDGGMSATQTGSAMGNPRYIAPEQLRDAKHVDARADVWSIGAIAYELVAGVPLVKGTSLMDAATMITKGDPPSVRTVRTDLPERIVKAIDAALKIDRDLRVATCGEMLALWDGPTGPKPPGGGAAWRGFWRDEAKLAGQKPAPPPRGQSRLADKTVWVDDKPAVAADVPAASRAAAPQAPAPESGAPLWVLVLFVVGAVCLLGALALALLVLVGAYLWM